MYLVQVIVLSNRMQSHAKGQLQQRLGLFYIEKTTTLLLYVIHHLVEERVKHLDRREDVLRSMRLSIHGVKVHAQVMNDASPRIVHVHPPHIDDLGTGRQWDDSQIS